jgi:hypothetical protein
MNPRVTAGTEAIHFLFATAGKFIRPVGVKLRAKGYKAQQENAQMIHLVPSIRCKCLIQSDLRCIARSERSRRILEKAGPLR